MCRYCRLVEVLRARVPDSPQLTPMIVPSTTMKPFSRLYKAKPVCSYRFMSSVPKSQSAAQPDRPTPNSSSGHDADTFGETPSGRDTQELNKQGEYAPKITKEFKDSIKRQAGDDHS